VKRNHRRVSLAAALLLVPALASCYQGQNAGTTTQQASGSGTQAQVGEVWIAQLTLVTDEANSGDATLIGSIVNRGTEADTVDVITADGQQVALTPSPVDVPGGQTAQLGEDVEASVSGMDAAAGQFVDVNVIFGASGAVDISVPVVPPVGFYEPYAPADTSDTSGGAAGEQDSTEESAETVEDGAGVEGAGSSEEPAQDVEAAPGN